MLYFIHGTDREKTLVRYRALIEKLEKEGYKRYSLSESAVFSSEFEGLIKSQPLFGGNYVVPFSGALEFENFKDLFEKKLPEISASPHAFVIREEKTEASLVKKIKKHAELVEEFSLPQKESRFKETPGFNVFHFTDALGERNRKKLWVLLEKGLLAGLSSEELFWKAVWQVKNMLLATKTKDAKESELNPFVYRKAREFARNFKEDELAHLSAELVELYSSARRGLVDFDTGLELFVLSV